MTYSTEQTGFARRETLAELSLDTLPERLRQAVAGAGWTALMPVQARAIPYLLAGREVMIQARTGSGKTGAYLLPMLERLDAGRRECQALVLVPTRELAGQVARDAETLCAAAGLRTAALYGGVGYGGQLEALKQGAHIVVGTPGRVLDHLLKRTLSLERLEMLVFDEADRMLSMGFYPDMKQMQRHLPRQTSQRGFNASMFSATFPSYVMTTAREFIRDPEFISLSRDHVHVTDTEHIFYNVPGLDKDRALIRIIEMENPASGLIFCNTKARVHYVAVVLKRFGYDADELSADLSQPERERVMERVRQGTLRFLVATDVAGRGIDLPELTHVFQYELPEDIESYIHRAGRTGRAGGAGVAMSLVTGVEHFAMDRIAKAYKIELEERPLPSDADVAELVAERVTALLEARLRERDKLQTERSQRFVPLARSLAESEDEQAVIAMLLDDYYQQMLHAPALVPGVTPPPSAEARSEPKTDRPPRRRAPRRR